MKKTVIKRRKRVPAAPGAPGSPTSQDRMTDQAAAEVLASVGRGLASGSGSVMGQGAGTTAEESEDEREQPRRKRSRKSRGAAARDKDRDREEMDVDDEDEEDGKSGSRRRRGMVTRGQRGSSRESNAQTSSQNLVWADALPAHLQMLHGHSHSHHAIGDSPQMDHQHRSGSIPRALSASHLHEMESRYGAGAPRGMPFSHSPNPHGGFDLPPLNAALGGEAMAMAVPMSLGMGHFSGLGVGVGAPGSYVRSGSASAAGGEALPRGPSRTHSPLAGPGVNAPTGGTGGGGSSPGYVLPHPHAHHGHHHLGHHGGPSPFYVPPAAPGTPPVPSVMELERHYAHLEEQKRWLEEMAERTERLMVGVKRGLEEMRAATSGSGGGAAQDSQQQQQSGATATPLSRSSPSGGRESVWPIAPPEGSSRE